MPPIQLFSAKYTIEAMKYSGYKDAAHAVAELIDNSIQAGIGDNYTKNVVSVEVICVEKDTNLHDRRSRKIEKIGVYDNASGMSKEVLSTALAFGQGSRLNATKGMGKYGIGLPNASISQCDRVEIWSWQKNRQTGKKTTYYTCLDIDDIKEQDTGNLPEPEELDVPDEWKKKITSDIGDSGTLIVWSKLSRLQWKKYETFFTHAKSIIGRMYRYFIAEKECTIRMVAYNQMGERISQNEDEYVKPNDPLYLMENTQVSELIDNSDDEILKAIVNHPIFISYSAEPEYFKWNGGKHKVGIKISYAAEDFRKEYFKKTSGRPAGGSVLGKHCDKNQGVSIVRAGRELQINKDFEINYDPTERWWGVEVSFDPILDVVFGVTNNKQFANSFQNISILQMAKEEGIDEPKMQDTLEKEEDPRLIIAKISGRINRGLSAIRAILTDQTEGQKTVEGFQRPDKALETLSKIPDPPSPGQSGLIESNLTTEQQRKRMQEDIDKNHDTLSPKDKKILLDNFLKSKKYVFDAVPLKASDVIFDYSPHTGKIKIDFNLTHPIYQKFMSNLQTDTRLEQSESYDILRLLFAAWGQMEDDCVDSDKESRSFEDIRKIWGRNLTRMLKEYYRQDE